MPQKVPGAVGEQGCRRRSLTLPCATERCAHPRLQRLVVPQRNGEIRGIDRQRGSVWAGRMWPFCRVTLSLRSPCGLKSVWVDSPPCLQIRTVSFRTSFPTLTNGNALSYTAKYERDHMDGKSEADGGIVAEVDA